MTTRVDVFGESLDVASLFPTESFYKSEAEKEEEKRATVQQRLAYNPDTVLVHDTDADGYGTAVMTRFSHPNAALLQVGNDDRLSVRDIGTFIVEELTGAAARVILADLSLNVSEEQSPVEAVQAYVAPYLSGFEDVYVCDHHEWPAEAVEWLTDHNDITAIIDSDDETPRCATKLLHDEYVSNATEELSEFAAVTNDHDVWIKEDPRSDRLAQYAGLADVETYVEEALDHGVAMLSNPQIVDQLDEAEQQQRELCRLAMKRASFHDIGGKTLALVYGRYPRSETGNWLLSETDADVTCMMQPSGGLSFRSSDGESARALAEAFNGGGHNDAAGGWLKDLVVESDATTYEEFWGSLGKVIQDAFLSRAEHALK